MIDIKKLRGGSIRDIKPNELFIPTAEGGEHFIAGSIEGSDYVANLNGSNLFTVGKPESWSRRPGIIVGGIRFEVDPDEAEPVFEDVPGMLVRMGDTTALMVQSDRQKFTLVLDGTERRNPTSADFGFRSWRIVVGEGRDTVTIFEYHGARDLPIKLNLDI